MSHAELAQLMAERLGRWPNEAAKAEYIAALTAALDDRRNRCACKERPLANLTDGVAPECLYAAATYQIGHQVPAGKES
jgi:hypothetical protein